MKPARPLLLSALLIVSPVALANIDIVFDYSYDISGSGFFTGANSSRQSILDSAASVFESRFVDTLSAINSGGSNQFNVNFFNPSNGVDTTINNYSVAADKIVVFVGAYNLGGGTLGQGGPGGFSVSGTSAFVDTAVSRGEPGALGAPTTQTDFGPWGGSLSFDTNTAFYFDSDPTSDEDFTGFDFYSVAVHELGHLLGFGTADSYYNRISNSASSSVFTGPAVTALTGLSQPVTTGIDGGAHWVEGLSYGGQEAAMTPSIASGTRKRFTELDFAALQDTGWEVSPVPEAQTWAMMLVGLGLLGWRARDRARNNSCKLAGMGQRGTLT